MLLQEIVHEQCSDVTCQTDTTVSFTVTDVYEVLQQSVSSYYIAQRFKVSKSDTSYVNVKDLFFTSLMATIQGFQHTPVTPENAEHSLHNVLESWHFRRIPVPGDGNCLFTAIAMGIIDRLHNGDQSLIHLLKLDENATITSIVKVL